MVIKEYRVEYLKEMTELFYNTVHTVNARDYTKAQLNVWATGAVDLEKWHKSFSEHYTVLAFKNNLVVGFGDIDKSGYLDRLYVHRDYQGQGIGGAICDRLEEKIKGKIYTYASITAKPFFEKRGYITVKENQVERQGVVLINYLMEKQ